MAIVCEYRHWEDGTYYFRSTMGTTPICKAYRAGDGWEVLFFRGPKNLGPYPYDSIERAQNHIYRWTEPREVELVVGERNHYGEPGTSMRWPTTRQDGPPLQTRHPSRNRGKRNWWAESR